jgi:hypothetical protein
MSLYPEAELGTIIKIGEEQRIFYQPHIYRELLLRGFIRTVISFFDPYIVGEHFLNTGLAGVIAPVFFLVGLMISIVKFKQLRFNLLLTWFLICFVFLSLIAAFPPRHTHLVSIIPCLAILSAVGLAESVSALASSLNRYREKIGQFFQVILLLAVCVACLIFGFQRYYLRTLIDYPNLFEDLVSWVAWHTDEPIHIIYMSNKPGPHRVEYILGNHLAAHSFTSYTLDKFSEINVKPGSKTVIFLESGLPEDVFLFQKVPDEFKWAETYWYRDLYIQGYAVSNTEIDLSPDLTLTSAVQSIIYKPVGYVLLALVLMIYIFGMLSLEAVIKRLPDELILELGTPPGVKKDSETQPRAEFYFKIRLPLKKRSNQLQSPE